jgi:hypothetical protein
MILDRTLSMRGTSVGQSSSVRQISGHAHRALQANSKEA